MIPETIPKCQWLIKKDTPAVRENIYAWTPFLAERPAEFEPFNHELPPLDSKEALAKMPESEPAVDKSDTPEEREIKIRTIMDAIPALKAFGYTSAGLPKIKSLQDIVEGFDITSDLRDEAWGYFREALVAKEGTV